KLRLRRDLVIDADVELVCACSSDRCGCIDVRTGNIGIRNQIHDLRGDRIPAILRNPPQARRIPAELRFANGEWIEYWRAEQACLFERARYRSRLRYAFPLSHTFVIAKPEKPVFHDRPTHCRAELVSLPHGFRRSKSIREEIVRVDCIIPQK